ncbi:hypothetical protein ACOME3_003073 [Neoechinorhynchus agilis]
MNIEEDVHEVVCNLCSNGTLDLVVNRICSSLKRDSLYNELADEVLSLCDRLMLNQDVTEDTDESVLLEGFRLLLRRNENIMGRIYEMVQSAMTRYETDIAPIVEEAAMVHCREKYNISEDDASYEDDESFEMKPDSVISNRDSLMPKIGNYTLERQEKKENECIDGNVECLFLFVNHILAKEMQCLAVKTGKRVAHQRPNVESSAIIQKQPSPSPKRSKIEQVKRRLELGSSSLKSNDSLASEEIPFSGVRHRRIRRKNSLYYSDEFCNFDDWNVNDEAFIDGMKRSNSTEVHIESIKTTKDDQSMNIVLFRPKIKDDFK